MLLTLRVFKINCCYQRAPTDVPTHDSQIPTHDSQMKHPSDTVVSPIRKQATDALRRARKLPIGPHRNDLRQLAIGLRWLEKQRLKATVRDHATAPQAMRDSQS
jgi:hypothetical protein